MPNLLDQIQVIPPDKDDEPEDIFAAAPGLIFSDDERNHHGDPSSIIVYKSARFGNIELKTSDPVGEEERQLFSHYLWNAGIKLAELISQQDDEKWSVKGKRVLELGAGVGLCGIVATLAGSQEVVLSDYPASVVLGNIRANAIRAIPVDLQSRYRVVGHGWGEIISSFAIRHANSFSVILAADCYWMSSQHLDLVHSMLHFLTLDPQGRIFVVSGFHTGRSKLASFFDIAVEEGLEIEEIYEEDSYGQRRPWKVDRDDDPKKWLVIARLRRRVPELVSD